jgi:hypothetical protein
MLVVSIAVAIQDEGRDMIASEPIKYARILLR